MRAHIRAQAALILGTILICVILYPLFLWGVGSVLFSEKARGSLIVDDEKGVRGSRLIAQEFKGEEYFWSRPSAASFNGAASSGSNWSGNSPRLRDRVAQQLGPIIRYRKKHDSGIGDRAGPDIEKWALAKPERLQRWAETYEVAATNWAKTDFDFKKKEDEQYGLQGMFIQQWAKDHPEIVADWKKANPKRTDEPRPEDLAVVFFVSFSKHRPGKWPGVVEEKKGETIKSIGAVTSDAEIQANFFDMWLQANPDVELEPVPADMVTASGSGLDPHITLRNALSIYQLNRVAEKRGVPVEKLEALVKSHQFSPLAGLVGEPLVNVLELNLALDEKFPMKR